MRLIIVSSAAMLALCSSGAAARGKPPEQLPACPSGFNQISADDKCRVCQRAYNGNDGKIVIETKKICWADSTSSPGGVEAAPPKDKSR